MPQGPVASSGRHRAGARGEIGRLLDLHPATLFLCAALCASAYVLLLWQSDLSFFFDEWDFLLHRRGLSAETILAPHNEHIAALPVLVYKSLLALFGMDSPRPFQIVGTLAFLASAALLFAYVRSRAGGWLALAATLPVLFFGPSWIDLLWPFQMAFWGSLIGGIGALLLLGRQTRRADILACVLLGVSMASSSLGIPFAIGVAVLLAAGEDRRERAFVVVVPVALFALWWLGWGREAESNLSLDNLVESPIYVLRGLSSSLSSMLGLAGAEDTRVLSGAPWRWAVLALAATVAGWRIHRLGGGGRWLWATIAILASFWFLAGLNAIEERPPETGRYQVIGAILIILVAAELLRGLRVTRAAVIGALAVALASTVSNAVTLHRGSEEFATIIDASRAQLTALETTADTVDPDLTINLNIDAGSYLAAVEAYGSPAYSRRQLVASSELARARSDGTMALALGVGLTPPEDSPDTSGAGCRRVELAAGPAIIELPPGGAVLRASSGSDADVALRRYASASFSVEVGPLAPGEAESLAIPTDRSREPWELELTGSGSVAVCERR